MGTFPSFPTFELELGCCCGAMPTDVMGPPREPTVLVPTTFPG